MMQIAPSARHGPGVGAVRLGPAVLGHTWAKLPLVGAGIFHDFPSWIGLLISMSTIIA